MSRFSVIEVETVSGAKLVLSNMFFETTASRQKERVLATAPIQSFQLGEPIELPTEEIKSTKVFEGDARAAAEINQAYFAENRIEAGESVERAFVAVEDLIEGNEYRIELPRRDAEVVRIRAFHRNRALAEIENVITNHTEAISTSIVTWEEV